MGNNLEDLQAEKKYLERTLAVVKSELSEEEGKYSKRKGRLKETGREMWESSVHFGNDFEKMTEVNQHLAEVANQTAICKNTKKRVEKYKKMQKSPYFGRIDFKEQDMEDIEKIYIGIHNLIDSKTGSIYVYDWRAPVSGMFYRFEPGRAGYAAPCGEIAGDMLLKRQYKIRNSELKYFFDCSININDEMLQEILGHNSSVKMRNIVETIQKEQDIIIRDTESEVLIVQGAAGSGKTSVALHRIAFLLYQGLESKLSANNILIISPNSVFSKYIEGVLPELGEENVIQCSVEDIAGKCFKGEISIESRNHMFERIISCDDEDRKKLLQESIEFKGSREFAAILDRLLWYLEHRLIRFEDVYYDGKIIENRQALKNIFLNNKIEVPMVKRLERIEKKLLDTIHPLQKKRLERIENVVQRGVGHEFEIKAFSRLLSIKEVKNLIKRLKTFTEIDCKGIYKMLFEDRDLFNKLAEGITLPYNIDRIIKYTAENLRHTEIPYEDAVSLLYLKLKLEGSGYFPDIRQVVIDEAQDYYPVHFEAFKLLFRDARYTIVGDVAQTIERCDKWLFYNMAEEILGKRKTVKLFLSKSYRSSFEISRFAGRLLDEGKQVPFERHEAEPVIVCRDTREDLDKVLIEHVSGYAGQGFETIAVLCKTVREAENLYLRLKADIGIKLLKEDDDRFEKGIMLMPVYLSKGLEFDVVFVFGAEESNFNSRTDKQMLYIACTRALHRLEVYSIGKVSAFLNCEHNAVL